jgi:1-acyl-sn-glycerol-3-phosphate acyltransferase
MATTFNHIQKSSYSEWLLSNFAAAMRAALQKPVFAILKIVTPVHVKGIEMLAEADPPALLVANHTSHLDTLVVLRTLPPRWRNRVAVAAAADYFYAQPWIGAGVSLLVNAFPFRRFAPASHVKDTLEHCAWLGEHGWSILLYPEGTRSTTGEMKPFKGGVGMLALHLGVPVIPIYTEGLAHVLPKGRLVPQPGPITITFGRPLTFAPGTDHRDATAAIEQAVRALAVEGR